MFWRCPHNLGALFMQADPILLQRLVMDHHGKEEYKEHNSVMSDRIYEIVRGALHFAACSLSPFFTLSPSR